MLCLRVCRILDIGEQELTLHSNQQQVDVKRILLTMTLILLVNSAVNYLNDWADYT